MQLLTHLHFPLLKAQSSSWQDELHLVTTEQETLHTRGIVRSCNTKQDCKLHKGTNFPMCNMQLRVLSRMDVFSLIRRNSIHLGCSPPKSYIVPPSPPIMRADQAKCQQQASGSSSPSSLGWLCVNGSPHPLRFLHHQPSPPHKINKPNKSKQHLI
jgi:hypothetical protein